MNKLFLNALLILIAVAVPGASAQGPGGVEGTAAWFRTEAVAGDSLYGWKDLSGADLRLTRGGTEPAAPFGRTSLFNFNRAIRLPFMNEPADSTAASAVIRGHDLTQSTVCGVFIPMWLDPDTVHPDTPDGVLYTVLDGEGRITAAATDSVLVPAVPAAIGYSGPSAVPGYSAGLDVGSYNTNSIKIHTVHSVSHPVHGMTALPYGEATASGGNVAFTVSIPIPPAVRIVINPGATGSTTSDTRYGGLVDIDGDGCADIAGPDVFGDMTVRFSQAWRANLLTGVRNSMGGSFSIGYSRSEPTRGLPGGKTVMSSLLVDDGIRDDGPMPRSAFVYGGGRRDRREREFYGFGRVETRQLDSSAQDTVVRTVVRELDVSGYYTQGNLLAEYVLDHAGNRMSETRVSYGVYAVGNDGGEWTFSDRSAGGYASDHGSAWTPPVRRESGIYGTAGYVRLATDSSAYHVSRGDFGDLREGLRVTEGAPGAQGGSRLRRTVYGYTRNAAAYISGLVTSVRTFDGSGATVAQAGAGYDFRKDPAAPVAVWTYTQPGDTAGCARTDLTYDGHGNVVRRILPRNHRGQRLRYDYTYERDMGMYIERVRDSRGLASEVSAYDCRYGVPLESKDVQGYFHTVTTDGLGRVTSVLEPAEEDAGAEYTLRYSYSHTADVDTVTGDIRHPAYAVASHYDTGGDGEVDPVTTVAVADGFGRTVQRKKESVVTSAPIGGAVRTSHDMTVSGHEVRDALDRVTAVYYPFTEPFGRDNTRYNATVSKTPPARTLYDALDRVVLTELPDGTRTRTVHDADASLGAARATATDALGNSSTAWTDGYGNVVRTVRHKDGGGGITTTFLHDALGRVVRVTYTEGNVTESVYDTGGRRVKVSHPASGTVDFGYDPAGNLVWRETETLRASGGRIEYGYDHDRPVSVSYPDGRDDVRLYYGEKNARHNRRGRLALRVDGSGAEEYFYGHRGEVVKSRRTYTVPNQETASFETLWRYDSQGRVRGMTYPDGEVVTYSYDRGGALTGVSGVKDDRLYRYVDSVGYDCHGQRVRLVYGNGTETRYAYDLNRRLSRLKVTSASGTVMDDSYTFDAVGNVTGIRNQAGATAQGASAVMEHSYGYDGLYRLVSATGSYSRPSATASYSVGMSYDDMGRITSRSRHAVQDGAVRPGYLCSGYELAYSYGQEPGNRFRLGTVTDLHHRVAGTGTPLGMLEDTHSYGYDADGNLTYVSTARIQPDGTERGGVRERRLLWDAEGRMRASDDGGYVTAYVYDADGNRTVKQSGGSAHLYVNSAAQSGVTSTRGFTLYVGPWMTASEAGRYTKHFYAGGERVASKVGNVADYRGDELTGPRAGDDVGGVTVDYAARYAALTARIAEMYAELGVPYAGTDNDRNGALLSRTARQGATGASQDDGTEADGLTADGGSSPAAAPVRGEEETMRFFYHPDHLGSASYVTDRDGALVQHLEYAPFGEVFLDERGSGEWSSPYLFNAKELDPETGLYYYGARYYDPRLAMWISPDPLQEKYPAFTTYCYAFNNPVIFVDPIGQENWLFDWWQQNKVRNRIVGGVQMLGGAAAAVIGGVGGVVTAETGVGAAAGYFVLVSGIDNAVAGAKQMWTGETSQTVIYTVTEQSSFALGASPETATNIAYSVDFGASMVGGGPVFNKKALPAVQNATNSLTDDFITMRLRHHVNKSVKEVDQRGLAALTTLQIKASIKHPNLLPAFRGNRIDVMTRDKVKADRLLRPFKINSNYTNGPDFTRGNRWWDMTTPQQWQRHVDKYGSNGTLLNTAPKR